MSVRPSLNGLLANDSIVLVINIEGWPGGPYTAARAKLVFMASPSAENGPASSLNGGSRSRLIKARTASMLISWMFFLIKFASRPSLGKVQ